MVDAFRYGKMVDQVLEAIAENENKLPDIDLHIVPE